MLASSKMVAPRVKSQRGIMPNAERVLTVVIKIDRSMFPSRIAVQMLEAPPPGATPVKNIPSRIVGSLGKSTNPIP